MANVLQFPKPHASELEEALAALEAERQFEQLICAFSLAANLHAYSGLSEGVDCSFLQHFVETYSRVRGDIGDFDWERWQDVVGGMSFVRLAVDRNRAANKGRDSEKSILETPKVQSWEQRISARLAASPYYLFGPGKACSVNLEQDFDAAHNPGLIIASYLRAAFQPDPVSPSVRAVDVDEQLFLVISSITKWAMTHHSASDPEAAHATALIVIFMTGSSRRSSVDETSPPGAPEGISKDERLLLRITQVGLESVSQALFEALLDYLVTDETYQAAHPVVFLHLAELPFGAPYADKTQVPNETLQLFNDLADSSIYKTRDIDPLTLPYIPWRLLGSLRGLYHSLLFEFGEEESAWGQIAFVLLAAKYRHARCRAGGHAPLSPRDTADILWWSCAHSSLPPDDFAIAFSGYLYDSHIWPFGLLNESEQLERDQLERRASWYHNLARRSREDGYYELSAALLAFLVYSQFLIAPRRSCVPWHCFAEDFVEISRIPRCAHLLEEALAVTAARADTAGNTIEAMLIRQFMSTADRTEVKPPQPLRLNRPHRAETEDELKAELGPDALDRLPPHARSMLIDANLRWRLHVPLYYRNVIQNWGAIAQDFAKVFELTLAHYLDGIYSHYKTHIERTSKKQLPPSPTFGTLVRLLRNQRLPPDIQYEIVEMDLRLQEDPKFLERLEVVVEIRNRATHDKAFRERDLEPLLRFIFVEGGLKRFVELLPAPGSSKH